jgi:hypothetical protein
MVSQLKPHVTQTGKYACVIECHTVQFRTLLQHRRLPVAVRQVYRNVQSSVCCPWKHTEALPVTLNLGTRWGWAPVALPPGWTAQEPYFDSRQQQDLFLSSETSTPGPRPPQPIHWLRGTWFLEVKRQERETNDLTPSSAEVKNDGSCTSTGSYGVYLNTWTALA